MKELRFHGRREPRYDRVAPFVAAQKALSAVFRTSQRFGVAHLIDILRGHFGGPGA